MSNLFPRLVVISRSSSLPTCTNSLSAKSMPISSHVSLSAVYRADSSVGSCRPPGKAMWEDQRACELEEEEEAWGSFGGAARRMKSSSGVVRG